MLNWLPHAATAQSTSFYPVPHLDPPEVSFANRSRDVRLTIIGTTFMTTIPFLAFSLGGPEVAIIFVLMLLLFGAKKLPELARGMGKSLGEFKKAKQEFEEEIKYGDLQARDDKSTVAATAASATPVVSEATGKQQYPG